MHHLALMTTVVFTETGVMRFYLPQAQIIIQYVMAFSNVAAMLDFKILQLSKLEAHSSGNFPLGTYSDILIPYLLHV